MVIVVDKRKYEQLGSDLAKVTLRTKDIANIVNAVSLRAGAVLLFLSELGLMSLIGFD